ncbi:TMV resistance protein N-like [Eucalyptus grandis]|uniref:TMV resistance protein N-like n=1 Tax=Eucalyptus grandis TaxID=71139 RepID=UPI00192E8AE1|nr:TMV resistance protein N-like [Eucalyptus grandis]
MASEDVAAGRKGKREGSPGFTREVFLSFRGPDTRKGFTDHLYSRLVDAGIQVFRDDEDLPAGEKIKPELKIAIKQSRISIAILSKHYASSEHCLMELEQMWECKQSDGQILLPIFYDVSPSDLKDPLGDFGRSLKKHEEDNKVDANIIKTWRSVLAEIKKLRGDELKNVKNG